MEIIVFEKQSYYRHMQEVIAWARENYANEDKWVGEEEAMKILGVKSKSEMWKLRTEGKIRYSQPRKKIIRYDRESILQFLEDNAFDTF